MRFHCGLFRLDNQTPWNSFPCVHISRIDHLVKFYLLVDSPEDLVDWMEEYTKLKHVPVVEATTADSEAAQKFTLLQPSRLSFFSGDGTNED